MQWPWSESGMRPKTERRLFEDGVFYHQNGKAKFMYEELTEMPEEVDGEYPFLLLTGRGSSSQWHTGTRSEKSDVLRKLAPSRIYVEINFGDAERMGIESGSMVRVSSRRGALEATAFLTNTVQAGQVFIPMHYAETNLLTYAAFDPYSRQPSYKACAVAVRKL